MLYTYRIYRFVKFVYDESDKQGERILAEIRAGKRASGKPEDLRPSYDTAVKKFLEQRQIFRQRNAYKATHAIGTAFSENYLLCNERTKNTIHVTDKGCRLIDGVPFIRFGLWKAWYEEHGWLIPVFLGGLGLGLGSVIRHLWTIVFN